MEKKVYRSKRLMLSTLTSGILLTYISIDNMLEGPLRALLRNYISLKEFGSNIREEGLYYLILGIGCFQIIIALQSFIQPVIEINNGQIVTLIGPNGSGKTTTAKMILNILKMNLI